MKRYPTSGRRSSARGFTLIELLIVISIIALLATLAIFAVGSARVRARDAKRIADVKQTMNALELYAVNNGGYPSDAGTPYAIGDAARNCLDDAGFVATCGVGTTYMANVPANPLPNGTDYRYETAGCTVAPCADYIIEFNLEEGVSEFGPGNTACEGSSSGISCGVPTP